MTKFKELLQNSFSLAGLSEEQAYGLSEIAQPMSLKPGAILLRQETLGMGAMLLLKVP